MLIELKIAVNNGVERRRQLVEWGAVDLCVDGLRQLLRVLRELVLQVE
jgi:hypothetical protein